MLSGEGSLSASPVLRMPLAPAPIAGAGAVSINETMLLALRPSPMAGAGAMIAALSANQVIAAAMAGAGGLTVDLTRLTGATLWDISSLFAGSGGLTASALQQLAVQATFAGAGGLTVADLQKLLGTALFAGAGGYNAKLDQRMAISRVMTGVGALVANVTQSTSFSALDPVNSDTGIALSNANRTAAYTSSAGYAIARGTKVLSAGKKYFEITMTALSTGGTYVVGGGLVRANWTNGGGGFDAVGSSSGGDNYGLAATGGAWNYASNDVNGSTGFVSAGIGVAQNDTVMVAVDLATGKIYMGVNNAWIGSLTPAGGTGLFVAATGSFYPAVTISNYTATDRVTINLGNAAFKYTLPSGYTAWG